MEKPDIVLMGPFRLQMYLAEDMDPYIAELKASLKEMVGYASGFHVFLLTGADEPHHGHKAVKADIDRARALIGEE
jgi:hypothetical protein